ncbi:MAG: hypothetical protein ABIA02_03715 [Candidatus Falkowbacteria bacterium]
MKDNKKFSMGSFDWSALFDWDELYELAKTDMPAYEKKRGEIFSKYLSIVKERGTKEEIEYVKRLLKKIEKSRPSGDNLNEICLNIGQSLAMGINGDIKARLVEDSAKEKLARINRELNEAKKQAKQTIEKLEEANDRSLNALPTQSKWVQ